MNQESFDFVAHLHRQFSWQKSTFGPAKRSRALITHIKKELVEIEADPHDITEWVDLIVLATEGAMRHGATPEEIAQRWEQKQVINESRQWPDWRTAPENQPIEHKRE